MHPEDAAGIANSIEPDQTAPVGAVRSGSALFAQAYLSENLGSLRSFPCLQNLVSFETIPNLFVDLLWFDPLFYKCKILWRKNIFTL